VSEQPLAAQAERYRAGGISLIPVGRDKKPFSAILPIDPETQDRVWKPFQTEAADAATVARWCGTPGVTGIAAVCGKISGGLLILDFDEVRLYEAWRAAVGSLADGLPVQRTGEGFQVAVRCDDPGPNQPLAWVPDDTKESGRRIGIETRGEGGYALFPGSLHPNGRTYEAIAGDFADIPYLPTAQVRLLLAAARQLDEAPQSKQELERARRAAVKPRPAVAGRDGSVIDEWNKRVPIRAMLARAGYNPWRDRFTRPGDDASPGGVVVFDETGRSFHHSTNDPLHDGHAHDSFSVFCELEHHGDVTEAVKSAAAELGMANGAPGASGVGSASGGGGGASGGSVGAPGGGAPDSWPNPKPLPDALPPVLPFNPDLLPEAFKPWVIDIAERVQCPIDFVAAAAMVAVSAVIGRRVGIRPKREDDWLVVPNLWGAAVGRPGVMKTPAIQEPLKPLKHLEMEAKREFDTKAKEREAAERVGELEEKETDRQIREALSKKNKADALRMARESLDEEEGEPVRKRFLVNDSTVEKLGEILNQNPNGVLMYRDELIGLLKALDKEGQEGARSFYLEAWNGNGRYAYDRIGRGTIDIEAAIISIIGGIQPGVLSQYLRGATREGRDDDGLMQRFQLLVYPDISKQWVNVDRWPDSEARKRAWAVFRGLAGLEPTLIGADHDPLDPDGIPYLRFTGEAQPEFDAWREGLEAQVRSGELHPALESHLAKYRKLIPSLALLIHLADGGSGAVGIAPLRKAIAWGVYLESHARRIYAQVLCPDLAAARVLAKKIITGEITDGFALRDVYRNGWSGLSTQEDAKDAVAFLIDLDWLAESRRATEGRTATVYLINPRLPGSEAAKKLCTPSKGTDRTDRKGRKGASGGSVSSPQEGPPNSEPPAGGWEVVP
jgi:Protein of unknown function (DUF3987)/Bifunctional DNA primase/polymerase, N-terminal